jgi:hypothetical protein
MRSPETGRGGLMGHFGLKKTKDMLVAHFFWQKMRRDAKHYVSRLLALIKHRFYAPTCRVNVYNNHVFTLSTNLVP